MAQQIVTIEDLQQFCLQLLGDLKVLIQPVNNPSQREWLKSSDVQKTLDISHATCKISALKASFVAIHLRYMHRVHIMVRVVCTVTNDDKTKHIHIGWGGFYNSYLVIRWTLP